MGKRCEEGREEGRLIAASLEHYEKALKMMWDLFPAKVGTHHSFSQSLHRFDSQDKIIVVEEDLILSPDFLYTLALLSDIFRKDETISAIQMWNPNCKHRRCSIATLTSISIL